MVLSADTVSGPYFIEEGVSGETGVVLTFPMRKHGIYNEGTVINQLDSSDTACVGELNDGVNDGREVTLSSFDAVVQDYPHDGAGNHCTNAGFEIHQSDDRDINTNIVYYDYEEAVASLGYQEGSWGITPIDTPHRLFLERSINSITILRQSGGSSALFGSSLYEDGLAETFDGGFEAGWMTFIFHSYGWSNIYQYESNSGMAALTEPVGGLGSDVNNSWSGVPVIGFSAMAADVASGQIGETIELTRKTNRD
jgi:hypothetical protein